jgi:hypothetical protein
MKLPKNFGGQGMNNTMQQMKGAMARAQNLETELALEMIEVDKGPVKATFDGTGEIHKVKIDKSVVDPEDVEALEDLIVSAVKDGFHRATALRQSRLQEILPNIPNIPGL